MQIVTHLIDWEEAQERAGAGTLAELLYGEDLEDEDWEEEEEDEDLDDEEAASNGLWTDSYTVYSDIADAYRAMRAELPDNVRRHTDRFFNALISKDPLMELEGVKLTDGWLVTLTPQTAEELSNLADEINFKDFKRAFTAKCPRDSKTRLAEYAEPADPNRVFDLVVLPYLQSWTELLSQAADQEKGVLVSVV
ncbi:MAG: hypothetical protein AB1705_27535 [Verrucomicrobiota bacterium]